MNNLQDKASTEINLVEKYLKEGFPAISPRGSTMRSALSLAAKDMGADYQRFRDRVGTPDVPGRYKRLYNLEVNWGISTPPPVSERHIPIRVDRDIKVSDDKVKKPGLHYDIREEKSPSPIRNKLVVKKDVINICYMTDTHVAPGDNLDRLRWIARHVGETQPDFFRHGGDMSTFDSCSTHEPIVSIKAFNRPSIADDLAITEEAFDVMHQEIGDDFKGRLDIDLGNHEHRLYRYENVNPPSFLTHTVELEKIYKKYGWRHTAYGTINLINNVGFTHVPYNAMGKPYGSRPSLARDMTFDLVYGHTHVCDFETVKKVAGSVTILNGPCSLPTGHIEDYAKLNPTGWKYGIIDICIVDEHIESFQFVSMRELERRYG